MARDACTSTAAAAVAGSRTDGVTALLVVSPRTGMTAAVNAG
jgi:hypothetical protein